VKVTYIVSHTLFYDTRMYLLKSVGLVTTFAHSSRHMSVPCYKFEKILNRQSSYSYSHIWRTL